MHPRFLILWLAVAAILATTAIAAWADIIPSHVRAAQERLRANPDTYDRVDQFCAGKKRGDACLVAGPAFEGGGAGICEPQAGGDIRLTCARQTQVRVDRQIPEGGYGTDDPACRTYREALAQGRAPAVRPADCDPALQPVTDRFCRGVPVGGACTAELLVDGRPETHMGVCQDSMEYQISSRYGGRRGPVRTLIQCQPLRRVEHQYTPASWLDKLKQ